MLQRLHQLIHQPPLAQPVPQHLREEFHAWPARRRRQLLRKVAQRELMMRVLGQRRCLHERIPPGTRRLLWWTSWETIGDAICDLSPRHLVPAHIELHVLMPASLAPLFSQDRRFAQVHTGFESLPRDIDFLLLQYLSSEALRVKRKRFPAVPFASVYGHTAGEMFSRVHFADQRLRQLFGLPCGSPCVPRLEVTPARPGDPARCHVAVALGARDPRRRVEDWRALLEAVVRQWPEAWPRPLFHLLGVGNARDDVETLPTAWRQAHCRDHVARLSLLQVAQLIAGCDAFLGPDGGLMHVAAATSRPGLGLFSVVPPAYRLLPHSTVRGWMLGEQGSEPQALAQALIEVVACSGLAAPAAQSLAHAPGGA